MELTGSISEETIIECIAVDTANSSCFDCGTSKPLWASVNNGIMICLNCSGLHRNVLSGTHISKIRSISLDMWTEKQINLMKEGGNTKLRDFLRTYDLDEEQNIKVNLGKYSTKAADFYRRMLEANANN